MAGGYKIQDCRINLLEQLIRNQNLYLIPSSVSRLGVEKILGLNAFNSAFAAFIPAAKPTETPKLLFTKNHYRQEQVGQEQGKSMLGGSSNAFDQLTGGSINQSNNLVTYKVACMCLKLAIFCHFVSFLQIKNAMALSICGYHNFKDALPHVLQVMMQRDDNPQFVLNPNIWVISPQEAIKLIAIPADRGGKQYTVGDSGAHRSIIGHSHATNFNPIETLSAKETVLLQLGRYVTLHDGRIKMEAGPYNSIFLNGYDVKRLIGDIFPILDEEIGNEMATHNHRIDLQHCSLCNGR